MCAKRHPSGKMPEPGPTLDMHATTRAFVFGSALSGKRRQVARLLPRRWVCEVDMVEEFGGRQSIPSRIRIPKDAGCPTHVMT